MTRMSRGKIIVEVKKHDAGLTADAPSSTEDRPQESSASEPNAELEEINPLRDGNTFAPPSAPWVGAESAWRRGIVPPPHEEWTQYKSRLGEDEVTVSDLVLTDAEVATVLSTMPPAASVGQKEPAPSQLIKYAAVAALTAVTAWAVFGATRSDNRPSFENTATPAAAYESASLIPAFNAPSLEPETAAAAEPVAEEIMEKAMIANVKAAPAVATRPAYTASKRIAPAEAAAQTDLTTPKTQNTGTPNPYAESESAASSSTVLVEAATQTETAAETTAVEEAARNLETNFNIANPYNRAETKPEDVSITAPDGEAQSLSRETVRQVMDGIADQVAACGNGREEGKIVLRVVVSGATGRVQNADAIYAPYVNTPVGYCAARAVRFAKFPQFSESEMTIKYPFEF